MIDIHSHILPEVDDGARSMEESLEMVEEAKKCNFSTIISTCHYIKRTYEITEELRKKKIEELNNKISGIQIQIGSEIYADPDILKFLQYKKASTINNTRYVLFEIPFHNNIAFFNKMIDDLKRNGYLPIIAHPERYEIVKENPKIVEDWKKRGIYIQCNYESVLGKYGKQARNIFKILLKHELIDFLGSDVHRVGGYLRVQKAIANIKKIVDEKYFLIITEKNQQKVLKNEKIELEEKNEIKQTIFGRYR